MRLAWVRQDPETGPAQTSQRQVRAVFVHFVALHLLHCPPDAGPAASARDGVLLARAQRGKVVQDTGTDVMQVLRVSRYTLR